MCESTSALRQLFLYYPADRTERHPHGVAGPEAVYRADDNQSATPTNPIQATSCWSDQADVGGSAGTVESAGARDGQPVVARGGAALSVTCAELTPGEIGLARSMPRFRPGRQGKFGGC